MDETQVETDYRKYRGKCKEMSEALIAASPIPLRLVRGYYHCPFWGKQVGLGGIDRQGEG